jgi:ribosomal protein S18 acetylase RimI-like enzyme
MAPGGACTHFPRAGCWKAVIAAPPLTFRTIDPDADADLLVANRRDACAATFGDDSTFEGPSRYLAWLRGKVEEFPDGHVLALLGDRRVGHLELEVPYGLTVGYVSLFHVAAPFRRLGFGRRMNEYAERYFVSWEADRVELHVSPSNRPAVEFYRRLGYRTVRDQAPGAPLVKMAKTLGVAHPRPR